MFVRPANAMRQIELGKESMRGKRKSVAESTENSDEAKEVSPNGLSLATPKLDPNVAYMEDSNKQFIDKVLKPISCVVLDFRKVRQYAANLVVIQSNNELFLRLFQLSKKELFLAVLNKIEDSLVKVRDNTKQIDIRFLKQRKKLVKIVKKKTPSKAGTEASKIHARNLATRRQHCAVARKVLKDEDYKHSFKQGMPKQGLKQEEEVSPNDLSLATPKLDGLYFFGILDMMYILIRW